MGNIRRNVGVTVSCVYVFQLDLLLLAWLMLPPAVDRYVPNSESDAGVPLTWPQGDKTVIQVDMSSLKDDNTAMETWSIYKYLCFLEKFKKVAREAFQVSLKQ